MGIRIWQPLILLGVLSACSEEAEPVPDPQELGTEPARETGYLRCYAASPSCPGVNQASCVDPGGKAACAEVPSACATLNCACASSLCGTAACTDLPDGSISCAVAGPPATCAGVVIERPEGSFCVVPDGDEFPCPADATARSSQSGAAICRAESVPEPSPEAAAEIATAAVQTGRILIGAIVEEIEIAPEAYNATGVRLGDAINVALTLKSPFGGAEAGGDPAGPAALCHVTLDHTSQTLVDDKYWLRAWSRVTCGAVPPVGAYSRLRVDFNVVPPEPGFYQVRTPNLQRSEQAAGNPGHTIIVDQAAACGGVPSLRSCVSGYAFADCGGAFPPILWCDPVTALQDCRWFTGGCPSSQYSWPMDCEEQPGCFDAYPYWGPEPWDRAREMNLSLRINAAVAAPAAVTVTCACGEAPCVPNNQWLCALPAELETGHSYEVTVSPGEPAFSLNGFYTFKIRSAPSEDLSATVSDLVVEVDTDAEGGPRARACLFTDRRRINSDFPTVCAAAGELVLDRAVLTSDDALDAHGTASLDFPSVPGQDGPVHIDLAF